MAITTHPLWTLLSFRFKRGVLRFWQRHPAIMAPAMALLVAAPLPINIVLTLVVSKTLAVWLWPIIVLAAAVPSGMFMARALVQWVPMIPRDEQVALYKRMPKGCVPTRRLCRLEHDLIVATQGAEKAAWESEQALELGTKAAGGTRRPGRL